VDPIGIGGGPAGRWPECHFAWTGDGLITIGCRAGEGARSSPKQVLPSISRREEKKKRLGFAAKDARTSPEDGESPGTMNELTGKRGPSPAASHSLSP